MSVVLNIDSVDRSSQVKWDSVVRDNSLNSQPDTLKFKFLYGGTKTYRPTINDEVVLTVNGTKEFGGRIIRIDSKALAHDLLEYSITCKDYVVDLNGQLITERYTNETVEDIIVDINTNYVTGFTITNVNAPIEIESVSLNRLTPAQALEKLADLISYSWYVDYDKDIHFFSKNEEPAPFRLTDDISHADYGKYIFKSLSKKDDLSQLRNTIIVEGGEKVGNERTVTRLGSETSSEGVLDLQYKFSEKPTVEVNSVAQTVGLDFIDDDASFDVMWSFQEKYLRFTSGNEPADPDTIELTGNPLYPIVVNVPDPTSVAEFGTKEYVIKDKTIRSDDEAIERALAELRAYSESIIDGTFETREDGLRAGQLLTIVDTLRDINEQVLIQSSRLKFTDPNGDKQRYTVKFATLKNVGIIKFLQNQLKSEEIIEDEDETLLSYLQVEDTADFTDTLGTPDTSSPPYYWSNDAETTTNKMVWNFFTWS